MMPVARHETMKLWKHFHLSSTMAIDENSVRTKHDEITQFLILLTSCTLSFLRSFIHSLPPSKLLLAPILPTFHPAPSFPTCSIFNQTQPPWLISQFFSIQFSFFPLLSPFPAGLSSKSTWYHSWWWRWRDKLRDTTRSCLCLRHLELHQGCFWVLCLENQDR